MLKTYSELIRIPGFEDRFLYLQLKGRIGDTTFGGHRQLNQMLYRNSKWRSVRNQVILRDNGCDLAHPDFEIGGNRAYVHHINPITIDDILKERSVVFDPDNLITVSFDTHQAIHYGGLDLLPKLPIQRLPGDTCPWR